MMLEQPRINGEGSISERLAYLERYVYRLAAELQVALRAADQEQNEGGSYGGHS